MKKENKKNSRCFENKAFPYIDMNVVQKKKKKKKIC